MKQLLSIVFAGLVALFLAKSLVYAQYSPTDVSASVNEQQGQKFLWGEGSPRCMVIPGGDPQAALDEAAAAANIPLWSSSFTFNGKKFQYTMVGTNPNDGSATSKVPVVIIPLNIKFKSGGALSAKEPVCGGTKSAVDLTLSSPLFQDYPFNPGGTNVGTTQYMDAFQRANFWTTVSAKSPDYHVLLSPSVEKLQTITVPRSAGHTEAGPCAKIGTVDINFFNTRAKLLISKLKIPKTSLPLFVTYNTFLTDGGQCCILGYHSVTSDNHTYSVAAYSDHGIFNVPIEDIHAMSHELGEWLDDPLVNNATPAWGHIGQVSGCQNNLEVGDPVTGIAFTAVLDGTTYHPEDLVFLPWFSRQVPSSSVNGFFTFLNTFAHPQAICH